MIGVESQCAADIAAILEEEGGHEGRLGRLDPHCFTHCLGLTPGDGIGNATVAQQAIIFWVYGEPVPPTNFTGSRDIVGTPCGMKAGPIYWHK